MTQEVNPNDQQFQSLRERFDRLHEQASLSELAQAVTKLTNEVASLPEQIAGVRQRGYHFAAYLEQKTQVLTERWAQNREEAGDVVRQEAERLQSEVTRLRRRVDSAAGMLGTPALASQLPDLQHGIDLAEAVLKAAQARVAALFATLQTDTAQTISQLQTISWYLDERDEASFKWLEGESLFLAAKAEWLEGKDKPDGILYLTDMRLIFEQKEKTGKKLGLFGGKETQELEWELPLNQIDSVEAENKGFLGGKDMLNFKLGSGAPYGALTVEVKGGVRSKFWAAQIQRMITGETSDERAIQPDAETLEAIRKAPTACPSCGGTLPQLVASQNQIACAYCGAVIRV